MKFDLRETARDHRIIVAHRGVFGGNIPCNTIPAYETALLQGLTRETNALYQEITQLETALRSMPKASMLQQAEYTRDVVLPVMARLRAAGDALETLVSKDRWPMPTYQDLLTSV